MRKKRLIIVHCGIEQASQHVFDGKHAFEGLIKAGTLISHFFFPASTCHAARIFCYETWSTYNIYKKKCDDDKLEIISLFHGLHVKQKSSNPFFGLFVSFLNCFYCLVFYTYHSMLTVSNLYFHVNIIS